MNEIAELPLSVTEDQLFAIIGRLHVENLALRAQLEAIRRGPPSEQELRSDHGGRPERSTVPQTITMASPNE